MVMIIGQAKYPASGDVDELDDGCFFIILA